MDYVLLLLQSQQFCVLWHECNHLYKSRNLGFLLHGNEMFNDC